MVLPLTASAEGGPIPYQSLLGKLRRSCSKVPIQGDTYYPSPFSLHWWVFFTNNQQDVAREESISLKRLVKGDMRWITKKTVIVWEIDKVNRVLTLPQPSSDKLSSALKAIPRKAARVSKCKWSHLLCMLRIMVWKIYREAGMFSRIHYVLIAVDAHLILLTSPIHVELNLSRCFIASLADSTAYLSKIHPNPLTCTGTTDESLDGVGRVCHIPISKWFVWSLPMVSTTAQILVVGKNPEGYLTINYPYNMHTSKHLLFSWRHCSTLKPQWITRQQRSGNGKVESAPPQKWDLSYTRHHGFSTRNVPMCLCCAFIG